MIHRLYEHFLERRDEYAACEHHWATLVESILESLGQSNEWPPWIPRHTPNGTPIERDGNPMFDGRSARLDRAFRIIQHEPLSEDLEIVAWLSTCEPEYPDIPGAELVLNLSLSEESSKLAETLLRTWIRPETTLESMKEFIRTVLPPSESEND
jgi:hypothetical protein